MKHEHRLLQQLLATAPDVYDQLGDALSPSGPTSDDSERTSRGAGPAAQPAPARLDVADHRHQLLVLLRREVARFGVRVAPDVAGLPSRLVPQLQRHAPLLPQQRARELVDELDSWHRRARRLVAADPLRLVPLPVRCLASSELWECGGDVALAIPRYSTPYLTCRECRGQWHPTELPEAASARVPVHVAASLLGVSVSTVKRRAADRDSGMVRLGDVMLDTA